MILPVSIIPICMLVCFACVSHMKPLVSRTQQLQWGSTSDSNRMTVVNHCPLSSFYFISK